MLDKNKLIFWAQNNLNVILVGEHGTGKTAQVKETFDEVFPGKWRYFSGATLDPWVDFIGTPKERFDEHGVPYLDLVRPKEFATDSIEAIFMDEYNRSHKKVRNALMELIQFKSINGRKFHNLKVVWAAVNPDTEEDIYDVDKADPAQLDRFQIRVEVPYLPDPKYFNKKFGEIGLTAIEWWEGLPKEMQKKVSPRRLDYALDVYNINGDIRDVLDKETNPAKLKNMLGEGSFVKQLDSLYKARDYEKAKEFLKNENNYANCINDILKKNVYKDFFLPQLSKEKLIALATEKYPVLMFVVHKSPDSRVLKEVVLHMLEHSKHGNTIRKEITKWPRLDNCYCGVKSIMNYDNWGTSEKKVNKVNAVTKYDENKLIGFLSTLEKETATTATRQNILDELYSQLPEKFETSDGFWYYIKVLENILERSQVDTIKKNEDKILGLFNYCLETISKTTQKELSTRLVLESLRLFGPNLIRKLETSGLAANVIIPDSIKKNKDNLESTYNIEETEYMADYNKILSLTDEDEGK